MAIHRDQLDNESLFNLHNSRGIELAERGWLDEAIKEFQIAIRSAPTAAEGYDNLGNAYAEKGDLVEALNAYSTALSLEPRNAIALHNLGCFLSNHGEKLAARCFKEALDLEPDLYEARFNLGLCHMAEDEHELAIDHFECALAGNEDDAEVRFHLALSLHALEKYAAAIKELLKVIKQEPEHQQAWYYLGLCYQDQGFLEEGVNAFAKAIKLSSKDIEAVLSLTSLLSRLKRHKEAKALLTRAMQLDQRKTKDFIATDEYLCAETNIGRAAK